VATVSGDGLLHQVLNGLLDRPDWNKAIQSTVFGIVTTPHFLFFI